jgi:hypothetical protein
LPTASTFPVFWLTAMMDGSPAVDLWIAALGGPLK